MTISYRHQKNGYAYEMLREVIARIQKAYSKLDIVALIEPENAGSIRLFEKLGFAREGYAESIDSYVYTIPGAK